MRSSAHSSYLTLLQNVKAPIQHMHDLLDEIFLHKLQETIEIQRIPKDDEEEQKELDLKKHYGLFTREAKELN